jgi:hypothetical protein
VPERHAVQTTYRGQIVSGEWYVEDGQLHVVSPLGRSSGPAVSASRTIVLPSVLAQRMLWRMAKQADPKKPFFYFG